MIKLILPILSLFVFSQAALAQSFRAELPRQDFVDGESFTLRLELTDAEAKGPPDFSVLKNSFRVLSRRQSSVQQFINGRSSAVTRWDLNLMPLNAGSMTIPPITIETQSGELTTQSLPIQVQPPSAKIGSHAGDKERAQGNFRLAGTLSKTNPYRNERFVVSFRLVTRQSLSNLQIPLWKVPNAIVEPLGEPKSQREFVQGHEQMSLSVKFWVTPLKSGPLTLPPLQIQADAMQTSRGSPTSHEPDELFDDDDNGDTFAQMRKMMNNFAQGSDFFGNFANFGAMRTVLISSDPQQIQVLPPVTGVEPWLPATDMRLSETWSDDKPHVGDPITRAIQTDISGNSAHQLPNLEDQLQIRAGQDFKVYADQPTLKEAKATGEWSQKKEVFTFIPLKAGLIHLPEVKRTWWNTDRRRLETATLPGKDVKVLPAAGASLASAIGTGQPTAEAQTSTAGLTSAPANKSSLQLLDWSVLKWAFGIGALFTTLLCLGYIALLAMKRRLRHEAVVESSKNEPKHLPTAASFAPGHIRSDGLKAAFFPERKILGAQSPKEVLQILRAYGSSEWQLPENAPLSAIVETASERVSNFDKHLGCILVGQLESALYGGKEIDLSAVRTGLARIFFRKVASRPQLRSGEPLAELNPS